MAVKIATWNVNSINARLETALSVLKTIDADIVCLQELKCEDARFPREAIEELGYNVETHGQKTYNGVALLSKFRMEDVTRGPAPSRETMIMRAILEAVIAAPNGPIRVASLYLPNGNPIGTEKFTYKLRWMDRLIAHAGNLLKLEEKFVLAGGLQHYRPPCRCGRPAVLGGRCFVPAGIDREISRPAQHGPDGRVHAGRRPRGANIRSGIIKPAPGGAITASASISKYARRKRRTNCRA